jgi:hypothetical protein
MHIATIMHAFQGCRGFALGCKDYRFDYRCVRKHRSSYLRYREDKSALAKRPPSRSFC